MTRYEHVTNFDKSPDPEAAEKLAELMSEISEECYCAGWMSGTEATLWENVRKGPLPWGMGLVTEEEVAQLRALAGKCCGWIVWWDETYDGTTHIRDSGMRWLPTDEWEEFYKTIWRGDSRGN